MEVRLCAWPRWISRCRFDFRAFVTLASAMRVQPPILVPCFAKQISVVFHNAPSMIMILARVARSTGFSIVFPNLSWPTTVFPGGIWRCIARRRISFLALFRVVCFTHVSQVFVRVVREARVVVDEKVTSWCFWWNTSPLAFWGSLRIRRGVRDSSLWVLVLGITMWQRWINWMPVPLSVSDQSVFRRKGCFSVSCPYMWTHCTRHNYFNIFGEFCPFCCYCDSCEWIRCSSCCFCAFDWISIYLCLVGDVCFVAFEESVTARVCSGRLWDRIPLLAVEWETFLSILFATNWKMASGEFQVSFWTKSSWFGVWVHGSAPVCLAEVDLSL